MSSLPKPQLAAFLSLCYHLHHPLCLPCTSRGILRGKSQLNLLNQPPLPRGHLNQPPLSQSPTSQPPRLAQPHLPRGRPTTRSSTNENSAPRSGPRSPAAPGRTNENSRLGQPLRRSARLKSSALHINSPPQAAPTHSNPASAMARTYPYSLPYRTCLGLLEDPYSFSSLYIEDLYSGQKTYVKHIQQIIDLLPRTIDPSSRYTLRVQVTPSGHQRMRDSLRTALWWLLPRDGDFRRAADGLHYYLARQGRRVVLRGGNVTSPLHESGLLWIHDLHHNQPPRVPHRQTVVPEKQDTVPRNIPTKVPRNNIKVPRNNPVTQSSDARARAPLENIQSSSWYNSNLSKEMYSRSSDCHPVPRTNVQDSNDVHQKTVPLPPKRKRDRKHRRERRAREREERGEAFNHDARWASQRPGDPSSSSVPAQVTQSGLQDSDPISAMRPAVYYPHESVGGPRTNENSPFQIDLESGEFSGLRPGLYKPADPAPQHDTWTYSSAANSSDTGPPSPTRTLAASSSDSRTRTGIVYPLQPRNRRPDICIEVEASLPEPAALLRTDLQPSREAPTSLPRTHKRLSRKRRRNRSTALYRPAKRSPPWGRWCDL